MKIARPALCVAICLIFHFACGMGCFAQDDVDDSFFDSIVTFLKDDDNQMRAVGLEQVRTGLEGEAATKKLVALLQELSPQAQIGLISALADRGDLAARDAVLEFAKGTKDDPVRLAAIQAIGYLGMTNDVPMLVKLIGEASEAEKKAARESLTRLQGENVLPAIVDEMNKALPSMRVVLIEILATRRALDTIPDILKVAVDDNPTVRAAAMKLLGKLAAAEHVSGMVTAVLRAERGRERDAAEKAVMAVCARSEGDVDQRAKPLLNAYRKLNADQQKAVLSTLGRVGGDDALKRVEAAIANRDSTMHGLGIRAICNWPNATVASRLLELATSDAHPPHRLSTLRSLIRVAPLSDEKRTDTQRLELLKQAMSMATRYEERFFILDRVRTILDIESLRFVEPYLDQPIYIERACLSVVELAHHRELREPNKEEFDRALDRVIALSKDEVVVDRAHRYQKGETWERPEKASPLPKPPKEADETKPEKQELNQPAMQTISWWIFALVLGACILVLICWRLVSKR